MNRRSATKSGLSSFTRGRGEGTRRNSGRRVENIIDAALDLLAEHAREDINISMIADRAGINRTSIYVHFRDAESIFLEVSRRFLMQTDDYVQEYLRGKGPNSVKEAVSYMIDAICSYFNNVGQSEGQDVARHLPFVAVQLLDDFGRDAARTYRSVCNPVWAIEPLSEMDPFRVMALVQSSLFHSSIKAHGIITEEYARVAKSVSLSIVDDADRLSGNAKNDEISDLDEQMLLAFRKLVGISGDRVGAAVVAHVRNLASTLDGNSEM